VSNAHGVAPPHAEKPEAQVIPHTPASQAGVPFGALGHCVQLAPQWLGSVCTKAHDPEQFVCPEGHVNAHVYAPPSTVGATQFGAPASHAIPHPPQCAGAVMSVSHAVSGFVPQWAKPELHW
jgi:hypothetical protein